MLAVMRRSGPCQGQIGTESGHEWWRKCQTPRELVFTSLCLTFTPSELIVWESDVMIRARWCYDVGEAHNLDVSLTSHEFARVGN